MLANFLTSRPHLFRFFSDVPTQATTKKHDLQKYQSVRNHHQLYLGEPAINQPPNLRIRHDAAVLCVAANQY